MDVVSPQEIRIAVFGASASGKTSLLASYYGNQQRYAFQQARHYRLEAENIADGALLLERYHELQSGTFPLSTKDYREYRFSFRLTGLREPGLRIAWYDYPGSWWERRPTDDSERQLRLHAFQQLLGAQVGMLLLDGEKWRLDGIRYARKQLDQVRTEILRVQDELARAPSDGDAAESSMLPKKWIIALTKHDLVSELTAAQFGRALHESAGRELEGVAAALGAPTFGEYILLLSAAGMNSSGIPSPDVYTGLELIAPAALLAIVDEVTQIAGKAIPTRTLENILRGLGVILGLLESLGNLVPKKFRAVLRLVEMLKLSERLHDSADKLRAKQDKAIRRRDALAATVFAMRAELAAPRAEKLLYRHHATADGARRAA